MILNRYRVNVSGARPTHNAGDEEGWLGDWIDEHDGANKQRGCGGIAQAVAPPDDLVRRLQVRLRHGPRRRRKVMHPHVKAAAASPPTTTK